MLTDQQLKEQLTNIDFLNGHYNFFTFLQTYVKFTRQIKTHRRPRINKKWRKRYGAANVRGFFPFQLLPDFNVKTVFGEYLRIKDAECKLIVTIRASPIPEKSKLTIPYTKITDYQISVSNMFVPPPTALAKYELFQLSFAEFAYCEHFDWKILDNYKIVRDLIETTEKTAKTKLIDEIQKSVVKQLERLGSD